MQLTRYFCLMLLLSFIMSSCVGMGIKRGVEENIFYSSNPKLSIKLSPEFEFISDTNKNRSQVGAFNPGLSTKNNNQFAFENNNLNAAIFINFQKVYANFYWLTDQNKYIKPLLLAGYEEHQGRRYQYAIYPHKGKNQTCYLVKKLSYVPGEMSQELLSISYVKNIANYSQNCDLWFQGSGFNIEQQKQLGEFKKEALMNLQFIQYRERKKLSDKPSVQSQTQQPKIRPQKNDDDIESKLLKLKDLRDRWLITQEDYDKKKDELLNSY